MTALIIILAIAIYAGVSYYRSSKKEASYDASYYQMLMAQHEYMKGKLTPEQEYHNRMEDLREKLAMNEWECQEELNRFKWEVETRDFTPEQKAMYPYWPTHKPAIFKIIYEA